jgi:hypothetical protein
MNLHRLPSLARYAAFSICLLWCARAPAAGPSSDNPEGIFPCGPLPGNQEEYAVAVEAYQRAMDLMGQVLIANDASGFKKAMLLEVGKAHLAAVQSKRRTRRLELVGEPASFHFESRVGEMHKQLLELRNEILADDAAGKLVAGTRQKWLNEAARLQKSSIPKAEQLAKQEMWDEAAQALYDPIDKLTPQGMWYDPSTQEMGFRPFSQQLSIIEPKLMTMIRDRAIGERHQAIARDMPDFVAIQHDFDAAIQGVAAAGRASIDGQEHAGPALLAAIGTRWSHAQSAAWRTRAHCWGIKQQTGQFPPEMNVLEADHPKFTAAMVLACARLIESDAARAAANEIADLHREYVATLAPLLEFDLGRMLASGVGQSLYMLAAKSPEFAADLAAYARATSDLLRWRERAAEAQSRRYGPDFQASVVPLNEILRCNSRLPGAGSSSGAKADNFLCTWRIPDLIAEVNPKVVGQKAIFGNVTLLAAGEAVAIYDNRHYARLAASVDLSTTVAELKQCLFAQDTSPPLTLEAYSALATAEHGCCEQVGGQIEGFELEALMTLFASLKDDDLGLVQLGSLSSEHSEYPSRQLLVAFTVRPAWAQHRYGFVEIKGE